MTITTDEANNGIPNVMGVTVLGERGQLVIPKDVRTHLGLKPGERFVVMAGHGSGLMLVPAKRIQGLMKQVTSDFKKVSDLLDHKD